MVRFLLLLFVLSDWAYTAWSAPLREPAPGVPLSATQQVSPLALRFREQLLQQIELPAPIASNPEVLTSQQGATVERIEPVALCRLHATDLLYTLMSLQR